MVKHIIICVYVVSMGGVRRLGGWSLAVGQEIGRGRDKEEEEEEEASLEEEEEEEDLFKANAVNEEDPERDRATQV